MLYYVLLYLLVVKHCVHIEISDSHDSLQPSPRKQQGDRMYACYSVDVIKNKTIQKTSHETMNKKKLVLRIRYSRNSTIILDLKAQIKIITFEKGYSSI